jgi:hypothetical protein
MSLVFLVVLLLSISLTATSFILDARRPSNTLVNCYPNRHQNTNNIPLISFDSFSSTLLAMSASYSDQNSEPRQNNNNDQVVVITDLARYAIKGFSGDPLESVVIPRGGVQTFPDDRRFALLKETNRKKFDATDPEWLHKENFLCAFSAPELMAGFRSHYEIVERGDGSSDDDEIQQRLLTLHRRKSEGDDDASADPVLGPIDLSLQSGRDELASFFSDESNQPLVCVTKEAGGTVSTFQFGNTRAGVKNNPGGDTRTVHIVNRATVREFSEKTGLALNAMRFRPNIIIDGLDPWEEFNWVGRTLRIVPKDDDCETSALGDTAANPSQIIVKVLTKTVRCEGIGIDPLHPSSGKLDIPKLLSKNYPEHGPYLGVYASLEVIGDDNEDESSGKLLSVGDTLELL